MGRRLQYRLNSKQIRVGKLSIRYFVGGHGDPVVVIHGGTGGADAWLEAAGELTKHYRVYVPDLPGFGLSQSMGGDFEMGRYALFVEEFVAGLGLKHFNLVGHSLGGSIAAIYAISHPQRIKKLVLVDSVGLGKEITVWARLACGALARVTMGLFKGIRWLLRHFYAEVESLTSLSGFTMSIGCCIIGLGGQKISLLDDLSRMLIPTLLVWGAKDPVVPVSHGYAASQIIPHCQLKVFKDCGHSVYRQKANEFFQVLANFFG